MLIILLKDLLNSWDKNLIEIIYKTLERYVENVNYVIK